MPAAHIRNIRSEIQPVSDAAKNLLSVLLYFDIFDYPLTASEIIDRSSIISKTEALKEIYALTERGGIYRYGDYYTIQNNGALVNRRIKGNLLAIKYLRKARRISSLISYFPFVKSVMLSGSISKMYMDENSDIDYFIITEPNRLWIARFFFVLFHKTLFLNNTKLFCYNYMIASDHLGIAKMDTYTAAEIVTLIPTYGSACYRKFLEANTWTKAFFPNFPVPVTENIKEGRSWIKQLLEKIFSGRLGENLDIYLMKHTERRWHRRLPPHLFADPEAYMSLKRHTAKGHTHDHYPRILKAYQDRIRSFEISHGTTLSQASANSFHN